MLSILIPVYNCPVAELVHDLFSQCSVLNNFEILVADDASTNPDVCQYERISELPNVSIIRNKTNIGRAKIRNILADTAQYNNLLFIDSDAKICNPNYIQNYVSIADACPVICGGTGYSAQKPTDQEQMLRWVYGRKREMRTAKERQQTPAKSFSSFNFLIKKKLFKTIRFDEKITKYGHEDTLFGISLGNYGIEICHIDNPIIHLGLETGDTFFRKTEIGLETLHTLYLDDLHEKKLAGNVKVLTAFIRLKPFGVHILIAILFRVFKSRLKQSIIKKHNLKLFDAYKLGYFCQLRE